MEYFWVGVAAVSMVAMIWGCVGLALCYVTMNRTLRILEDIHDGDPTAPPPAKRKLFRRERYPEPEPGGTKVWPGGEWDEGLEREDV